MKIKILVENSKFENYEGEHGLSVLVDKDENKYLIDTGASGLFAKNAQLLGEDLAKVKKAFLSHAHYDHSGGYREFFDVNKEAVVYLQQEARNKCYFKIAGPVKKYIGIPKGIQEEFENRFVYINGYADLGDGIYILPHTTKGLSERGEHAHMYCVRDNKTVVDDFSHEQTVVFRKEEGLVLFNSCSHGGVENIIEEVKAVFPGEKIMAYVGGFHMMGSLGPETCSFTKEQVEEVAGKVMNSSDAVFYSGHCTGTLAYKWLKEVMGERLQALHSGLEIEL